jgi:hypothetical protein
LDSYSAGVYRSLLAGWWIDSSDIEEAVNGVCDELQPIEIDITNFVKSSCRVTHQLMDLESLLTEVQHSEEDEQPLSPSELRSDELVDLGGWCLKKRQN